MEGVGVGVGGGGEKEEEEEEVAKGEAVVIEMVDLDGVEDRDEKQRYRDSFKASYHLTPEEEAGTMSYQQLGFTPSAEQVFGEEHDLEWDQGELGTLMQLCSDLCQIDSTAEAAFLAAARFEENQNKPSICTHTLVRAHNTEIGSLTTVTSCWRFRT